MADLASVLIALVRMRCRLAIHDETGDGGRTTSLLDADGSLSGRPMARILPDLAFYNAPTCVR